MLQQISNNGLIRQQHESQQHRGHLLTSSAPLAGTVVIEIGHSVAAPFAGLVLGQLGAEVIKVEHPGGGDHARKWGAPLRHGTSAVFEAINREKHGLALDLRDEQARDALLELIVERADVVIQNLRPNSIEQLGLGATELVRRKPGLVYCNLTAFGGIGPMGAKPGYDPLMQAYGGLMSVTGEESRPPVRIGVSIVDMGTGMWSVIGIIAALLERKRTGNGGVVDTSLYETALAWMGAHVAEHSAYGLDSRRHGSGAPQIVPYEMFATTDGSLMVAAGNDALFAKLCTALGRTEWHTDERFQTNPARVRHRGELSAMLHEIFRTQSTAHWRTQLDAADIPNAPLRSVGAVIEDAQTAALEILQPVPGEPATITVGIPIRFDGRRPALRRQAPRLGESTIDSASAPTRATRAVAEAGRNVHD
jgi:crotonobetainyl-CoA:carnitine CoA-transferase CaiB-like acyl-CoA transferase